MMKLFAIPLAVAVALAMSPGFSSDAYAQKSDKSAKSDSKKSDKKAKKSSKKKGKKKITGTEEG